MIEVTAALAAELEHSPVPPEQTVAGTPTTAVLDLGTIGEQEWGVWEMTPGTMTDTEVEELFVVIAGRGTMRLIDAGETLELAPGTVGRLTAGARTEWRVTETLRKIWVA